MKFAAVENFPGCYWRQMRSILRKYKKEEEEEERRLIASYHQESVLDVTMETVLGSQPTFFLMLSLENGSHPDIVHYMQLHRTNTNYLAISTDRFNFSVQRAALRRFTTSMVNSANANRDSSGMGDTAGVQEYRLMRSSVVMRVGSAEQDEHSFLYRLAQMSDIDLPVFRTQQNMAIDLEISTVLAAALAMPPPPPAPPPLPPPPPAPPPLPVLSHADIHVITLATTVSGESFGTEENTIATPDLPTVFTAVESVRNGTRHRDNTPILYRYTTVSAPCVDFAGVLEMEFCESVLSGGVDSLMSVFLSLQGCALLNEVARCYSQRM
jgi:hypothetical protein